MCEKSSLASDLSALQIFCSFFHIFQKFDKQLKCYGFDLIAKVVPPCTYWYANRSVRDMRDSWLKSAGCGTTAHMQNGIKNAKSTLEFLMGKRPFLSSYSVS